MWQYISSSTIGTSHIGVGLPCQDAHQVVIQGDFLLVALADGLGTATQADKGATLAVQTALETLQAQTLTFADTPEHTTEQWQTHIKQAFTAAQDRLASEAKQHNVAVREYNTTLIVGIVHHTLAVVGHLGDGAVVNQTSTGELLPLSLPHNEEYANEVVPLTHDTALEAVRYTTTDTPLTGIAFLTDGLQALALELASGKAYQPFFAPFFTLLAEPIDNDLLSIELDTFLHSDRVCQKTDDDKTLVVATWVTPT